MGGSLFSTSKRRALGGLVEAKNVRAELESDACSLESLPKPHPPCPANITTYAVHHDDEREVVLFHLPPNATIPLHDHPKMRVHSRLLKGELRVRSFSWSGQPPDAERLDRQVADRGETPARAPAYRVVECPRVTLLPHDAPLLLTPQIGNLHEFCALSEVLILDVLEPPYDSSVGRDCHYYELLPLDSSDECGGSTGEDETRLVRPIGAPSDLTICGGTWAGVTDQ